MNVSVVHVYVCVYSGLSALTTCVGLLSIALVTCTCTYSIFYKYMNCVHNIVFNSLPQFLPGMSKFNTSYAPNESVRLINCERHIISSFILLDILLLASYIFGLYLFSRGETEYLSNLAEKVRGHVCVCPSVCVCV